MLARLVAELLSRLARRSGPGTPAPAADGDPAHLNGVPHMLPPIDGLLRAATRRRAREALNILSIYVGHDAAVAVFSGAQLRVNLELERYTRIKHDYGYREDFVRFCLERAGLTIEDIDLVCLNRWPGIARRLRAGTVRLPCEVPDTKDRLHLPFEAEVLGRRLPALAVNHHAAHCAGAFFTSPFDEAAILVLDGGGDSGGTVSWAGGRGNAITFIVNERPLSSIAWWWASLTLGNYRMPAVHEMDPGAGSGKLMALAAYGSDADEVRRELAAAMRFEGITVRQSAQRALRVIEHRRFDFNDNEDCSDTCELRSQQLARALQEITNEEVRERFRYIARRSGIPNLCYAGGVALNCIATSKAMVDGAFSRIHVPPFPNDSGLALGMALYAVHQVLQVPRRPGFFSPYTGPDYSAAECDAAVREAGAAMPFESWAFPGVDAGVARIADLLAAGDIVLMWRNRSEAGPRALGHRSFLCRPDLPGIRDRMNAIKRREWYRPFAPILLFEEAGRVLETVVDSSWYMTTSSVVRPEWRERLAGVCHVDNTTRPQLLDSAAEPFLYAVLSRFAARTGIPALLNTSFNLSAPIVETPGEAIATWLDTPVPHLVLEDRILTRAAPGER